MHLNTCTGCKFKVGCDHAAHLRTALKGHGIRSVKFACAKREPVFQPGDPAIFTTFTADDNDDYRHSVQQVAYPGVVIEQKGGKVLGFVKPGAADIYNDVPFEARGNGYVKMPLTRVRPDPSREPVEIQTCRWCASNYAIDGRCDRDPHYTSPGQCLKRATEVPT